MARRPKIPTPLSRWWQETRTRYFPRLVFGLCVLGVAMLWRGLTVTPVVQNAIVVSSVSGVVAKMKVSPRQPVRSGDPVAEIVVEPQGTRAQGGPMTVTATSDGVISTVYRRVGESVRPGDPIVAIAPTPGPVEAASADKKPVLAEAH